MFELTDGNRTSTTPDTPKAYTRVLYRCDDVSFTQTPFFFRVGTLRLDLPSVSVHHSWTEWTTPLSPPV